jgi:type I restriction enzyme, S subunit
MVRIWEGNLKLADGLRRSHLQSAFGTKNPYPKLAVRETGNVQLGRQRAPKYQTGSYTRPYLRVANVFDGYFDYSDVLEMDFDERDFETFRLKSGDILLNEGQSRELVGRCAIYDGKIKDCCFQNTLIRYQAEGSIVTNYAFAFFQYCFHFGLFAAIASQTTSIAHLGSDRFGNLLMPIPPKNEQLRVAKEFEKLRSARHEVHTHLTCAKELRELLINSLTL